MSGLNKLRLAVKKIPKILTKKKHYYWVFQKEDRVCVVVLLSDDFQYFNSRP